MSLYHPTSCKETALTYINRAEYHALNKKTTAGLTYFLGYEFAMGATPHALTVFQWKEYVANNEQDGGANIPLALEVRNGQLCFQWQASSSVGRVTQWSTPAKVNTVYTIGIEILAKSSGGYVRVWLNGNPVTFTTTKTTTLTGNMFPGRSDPKVGAYRGEEVAVDTFVYQLQISNSKADVDAKFFSTGSSGGCSWAGHCAGKSKSELSGAEMACANWRVLRCCVLYLRRLFRCSHLRKWEVCFWLGLKSLSTPIFGDVAYLCRRISSIKWELLNGFRKSLMGILFFTLRPFLFCIIYSNFSNLILPSSLI